MLKRNILLLIGPANWRRRRKLKENYRTKISFFQYLWGNKSTKQEKQPSFDLIFVQTAAIYLSAWGLEQHKNEKLSTSCPALNSGNQSQSSLPMTQGHTFMLFYSCEAQARVRQGSARDGPLRRKALKLKPLPRAYIKVGCHHHHHPPPTISLIFLS